MAYDLEEQEKIEELKAWWGRYGNLVTAVIALAALGVLGLNGYNAWQEREAAKASVLYDQMQKAVAANNTALVKETTGTLLDKYGRTAYGQMAALSAASVEAKGGDLKAAAAHLQWAVEHARDPDFRAIARLRLSSVQLEQGAPDAALQTLAAPVGDAFQSAFADRRGDIYVAQNKLSEARTQYQSALDHLNAVGADLQTAYAGVEHLKLDALASATGPAAEGPALAAAASSPAASASAATPPSAAPAAASGQ